MEQRRAASDAKREEVKNHPLVREVMRVFPGATIADVRPGNGVTRDRSMPEDGTEDFDGNGD